VIKVIALNLEVNSADSPRSLGCCDLCLRQFYRSKQNTNVVESNKYLITKGIKVQRIRRFPRNRQVTKGPQYTDGGLLTIISAAWFLARETCLVEFFLGGRDEDEREQERRKKRPCKPVWPLAVSDTAADTRSRRIETPSRAELQPFCSCRLVHWPIFAGTGSGDPATVTETHYPEELSRETMRGCLYPSSLHRFTLGDDAFQTVLTRFR